MQFSEAEGKWKNLINFSIAIKNKRDVAEDLFMWLLKQDNVDKDMLLAKKAVLVGGQGRDSDVEEDVEEAEEEQQEEEDEAKECDA